MHYLNGGMQIALQVTFQATLSTQESVNWKRDYSPRKRWEKLGFEMESLPFLCFMRLVCFLCLLARVSRSRLLDYLVVL
jgi:hypothetical protein